MLYIKLEDKIEINKYDHFKTSKPVFHCGFIPLFAEEGFYYYISIKEHKFELINYGAEVIQNLRDKK